MRFLDRTEQLLVMLVRLQAMMGVVALIVLATLVIANVLLRWGLGAPLMWVSDIESLVIAVAVAACFASSFVDRHHMQLRLLGNLLGPRATAFLDILASLATLVIFALLLRELVIYTDRNATRGLATTLMNWPRAPFWWTATGFIAIAVLALALRLLIDIIRACYPGSAKQPS